MILNTTLSSSRKQRKCDGSGGRNFEKNSIFNNDDIIAGEDIELIFEAIASLFQYMRKDKDEIRRITVQRFSRDVVVKFPDTRPDER